MRLPPGLRRVFRLALLRRPLAQEIDAELEDHIARRADDLVARGWPAHDARAEALRRFGPVDPVAAECRTIDTVKEQGHMRREWWADFGQDLQYAWRGLRRAPAAALVAALTFALGIGVNAAVFSLVDGVILKPLPYANAHRVVRIYEANERRETGQVTIADFRDWRAQSTSFDAMAVFRFSNVVLTATADAVQLSAARVSANFFDVLGVAPALGRGFAADEELPGAARMVILSHNLWQTRFGGDPALTGRAIPLDGAPATVIGILGPDFVPPLGAGIDVWLASDFEGFATDPFRSRGMHFLAAFARLRLGASFAEGQAELQTIGARLEAAYPASNIGHRPNPVPLSLAGIQSTRPVLLLVMGAVGLVLLIACANLANLIFARALGRSREFALRAALGATRRRLVRQVLTEQGMLALLGGAIGLISAAAAIRGLALWLAPVLPRAERVTLDGRVVLFALGLTVLAAVLSGLLPAVQAGKFGAGKDSISGGARSTATRAGRRMRSGLVAAQVALAVILLSGAGLVVRSLTRLLDNELGFEPARVLTFSVPLRSARYETRAARLGFVTGFLDRVSTLPGVDAVGASYSQPMANTSTTSFDIPGRPFPEGQHPDVGYNAASSGQFAALRIPLISGRLMDERRDHLDAPPVVVINESLAKQYWPGEDPVGRFIRSGPDGPDAPPIEIIGVVGDIRRASVDQAAVPELYFAASQDATPNPSFAIRTAGTPSALTPALRAALREMDPALPMADVAELQRIVDTTVFRPRFLATLFLFFAGVALALAGIGIYGVIAFVVAEQVREIGIRRALGATGGEIRGQVMRRGMAPVVAGLVIGLVLAVSMAGLISSLLYGVAPTDPLTLAGVVAVTMIAGLLGCLAPARRATRIEPVVALREG